MHSVLDGDRKERNAVVQWLTGLAAVNALHCRADRRDVACRIGEVLLRGRGQPRIGGLIGNAFELGAADPALVEIVLIRIVDVEYLPDRARVDLPDAARWYGEIHRAASRQHGALRARDEGS